MYAVISDRGRQARVRVGDVLRCDKNPAWNPGDAVTFDRVLLVSNEGDVKVGRPTVEGASVTAEVLGETKGDKVIVFRFKRRKNVRVKRGHRQRYADLRVRSIDA